ncbi:lipopolysaccharide/colanic/teichoic acid biosynthesis glycosyltransferase [Oceanicella actignis]|nr:lipopolysaccharide/colanic/teichoic acid biosynthesis glycosyltransferase [Oceanicella actignis]
MPFANAPRTSAAPNMRLAIMRGGAHGFYARRLKRPLDIALVLLMLPAALPVIALLALATAAGGGAPFFGHARIGRGGRPFRCWKIRTMRPDADAALERLLRTDPEAARRWRERGKLDPDPRVTPLGRFLRKTSLDELPQLWNVLRGDMSLVGPRPVTAEEMVHYAAAPEAYLPLRPGLTGLWQTGPRNQTGYAERVAIDLDYSRRVSLALDLRLLLRTVRVVLRPTGL